MGTTLLFGVVLTVNYKQIMLTTKCNDGSPKLIAAHTSYVYIQQNQKQCTDLLTYPAMSLSRNVLYKDCGEVYTYRKNTQCVYICTVSLSYTH